MHWQKPAMTTFAENMDSLMTQRGMSLHRLARAVHYDVGYLCKIKNGQKPPSRWMATLVDDALSVDGSLIALAPFVGDSPLRGYTEGDSQEEGDAALRRDAFGGHWHTGHHRGFALADRLKLYRHVLGRSSTNVLYHKPISLADAFVPGSQDGARDGTSYGRHKLNNILLQAGTNLGSQVLVRSVAPDQAPLLELGLKLPK